MWSTDTNNSTFHIIIIIKKKEWTLKILVPFRGKNFGTKSGNFSGGKEIAGGNNSLLNKRQKKLCFEISLGYINVIYYKTNNMYSSLI